MCKSATVSSLWTIEHSPSVWAGFAPKLTVTLTVVRTKLCLTPQFGFFVLHSWATLTVQLEALRMPFVGV